MGLAGQELPKFLDFNSLITKYDGRRAKIAWFMCTILRASNIPFALMAKIRRDDLGTEYSDAADVVGAA